MMHYDEVLKAYSNTGLRSAAEWQSLGREVEAGAAARVETTHQRAPVLLYTRDQTRRRVRGEGRASKPAATLDA